MTLGLPDKVRVGPFDFEIVEMSKLQAQASQRYGECSTLELVLRLDSTMHPIKAPDTLLHELLHAIWWVWNVEDGDKEERTVATLATGLYQVMRDNPALLAWLNERCAPAVSA